MSPGSGARLVGALSCAPKVCGVDFWSGHIPRVPVRFPVGTHMGGTWPMFLSHIHVSLSLSLPLSLKSINISFGED